MSLLNKIENFSNNVVDTCTKSFAEVIISFPTIEKVFVAVKIVEKLAKLFGFIGEDDQIEEIGDKCIQAEEAGYTPEDFADYDEYLEFIKDFEVDEFESEKISQDNKRVKGLEVLTKKIDEEFDITIETILPEISEYPNFYTAERVKIYIERFKNEGINLEKIEESTDKILELKLEIEKEISPELSNIEIIKLLEEKSKINF